MEIRIQIGIKTMQIQNTALFLIASSAASRSTMSEEKGLSHRERIEIEENHVPYQTIIC